MQGVITAVLYFPGEDPARVLISVISEVLATNILKYVEYAVSKDMAINGSDGER